MTEFALCLGRGPALNSPSPLGEGRGEGQRRWHRHVAGNPGSARTLLQFWSDAHPETPVDVFVAEPFDFDREYRDALVKPLGSIDVRFVSIRALIAMKEAAGPAAGQGRRGAPAQAARR